MAKLFTYTIPVDDGAAPNPFYGMCTLAICKPVIRRVAQKDDWVAGLGSKNAPSGDLSGRLVYAMRIDEVLSLKQYDEQACNRWLNRIPNLSSHAIEDRLGDCIYDYSSGNPVLRPSIHTTANMDRDLGGKNVLISWHYYYFGNSTIALPDYLLPICHQMRGHRSTANAPYLDRFIEWLESKKLMTGRLYGYPDFVPTWNHTGHCIGCDRSNARSCAE